MKHAVEVRIVVILGLESLQSRGLQASLRGDLDPLDEVKDGELLNLKPTTKEKIIWDFD